MLLRDLYNHGFRLIQSIGLRFFLLDISRNDRIWIFDIDNTLADTWPSLKVVPQLSDYDRLFNLIPHEQMCAFARRKLTEGPVVYITHRTFRQRSVTLEWLRRRELLHRNSFLIVVASAEEKVTIIKRYLSKYKLLVVDDLSYNHENGEVKYYNEVISSLKSMGVRYYGKSIIDRYNRKLHKL